jgi:hypothetical protein
MDKMQQGQRREPVSDSSAVLECLEALADQRQANPTPRSYELYVRELIYWPLRDVREVCIQLGMSPRMAGETAFPALGNLIGALKDRRVNHAKESEANRYVREMTVFFWMHIDFLKSSEGITEQQACDAINAPGWTCRRARPEHEQRDAEYRDRKVWLEQSNEYKQKFPYVTPGSRA